MWASLPSRCYRCATVLRRPRGPTTHGHLFRGIVSNASEVQDTTRAESIAGVSGGIEVPSEARGSADLLHEVDTNDLPSGFPGLNEQGADDVTTKFAHVAVLGYPSAGKSSLMNKLVGGRVAAVSRKVQTTRRRIIGLLTKRDTQLAFCDTPGVVQHRRAKEVSIDRRGLAQASWGAATEAELAVLVVDVSRHEAHWNDAVSLANDVVNMRKPHVGGESRQSIVLALNKADKVKPRSRLLEAVEFFSGKIDNFDENFYEGRPFVISAHQNRGVDSILKALLSKAPRGEFLMDNHSSPADYEDMRDTCLEHIWEKLLHRVHQEVPYTCSIENDSWRVLPSGDISAAEIIRVARPSQVPLLIGHQGEIIRFIAEEASASASQVLGRKVFLKLRVGLKKKR